MDGITEEGITTENTEGATTTSWQKVKIVSSIFFAFLGAILTASYNWQESRNREQALEQETLNRKQAGSNYRDAG
jgi:hypothetical protein